MAPIFQSLAEIRVHEYDRRQCMNPITYTALTLNGKIAITFGESQIYRDYPDPDDVDRFALIAHETTHSMQEKRRYDSTGLFLLTYAALSVQSAVTSGSTYRANIDERQAYAIGNTVQELLRTDQKFRDAVKNGTTQQLGPDYARRIQEMVKARFDNP
jgi:hypothetical protein